MKGDLMKTIAMRRLPLLSAFLAGGLFSAASCASAAVLYSQNFEAPVALSSTSVGPGGYVQVGDISGTTWQIQGGGGADGASLTAGVDANGSGGGQSLFGNWDHTPAAPGFYTYNQYTIYGLPAPGAGVTAGQVKISMDLFIEGSSTNNPLNILYQAGGDKGFRPVLANGAYTSVSFTLDQTNGAAFDPTLAYNIRVEHGADGFGFDANNIVRIDNVRVEVIPEPATLMLAGVGGLLVCSAGRRRNS
jgi:hypothetical protein